MRSEVGEDTAMLEGYVYHVAGVQMPGVQRRGEASEGEPPEKRKNQIVKDGAGGGGIQP